jgi:hypothetical protein
MWECAGCGCKEIAADLVVCPMCSREKGAPSVADPVTAVEAVVPEAVVPAKAAGAGKTAAAT